MRAGILLVLLLVAPSSSSTQQSTGCTVPREACRFFDEYLAAFNRRDWAAFSATFDSTITVMFDRPAPPVRRDGRPAVEQMFRRVFPPPGQQPTRLPPPIVPESLLAQDFGDVVIISFHIRSEDELARRTVVLHRGQAGWRVVHIHASSSDLAAP